MGRQVMSNAQLCRSMGATPSTMGCLRMNIKAGGLPAAGIQVYKPMVSIKRFRRGYATSYTAVIAASAATSGVHAPAPRVPTTTSPWSLGTAKGKIEKQRPLEGGPKLQRTSNGSISVFNAGQTKVTVTG